MLADALEHLVRGIVDHPDDVRVNASTLRRGDLLVFTNLLAHTGTENRSGTVRWSVDMRFEATLGPGLTERERLGYQVTHRRMASRQAVPLRIAGAAGPETWEDWQRRRATD